VALGNYLRQMGVGSRMLRQGKLLLVGEGGAGKTTLLDVLEGKDYNPNSDSTHGLERRPLRLTAADGWEGTLHAWDFSGQAAMRPTHQLFFTSPALYLLVWNHRDSREDSSKEITEWLTLIDQRTEGRGRVLLVAKKAEHRSAEPPDYDEIHHRFGPDGNGILIEDGCFKVDSEGPEAAEQVRRLKQRIARFAAEEAPAFNEERPTSWIEAQAHFARLGGYREVPDTTHELDATDPLPAVAPPQGPAETPPYMEWGEFTRTCSETFHITDPEEYARAQNRLGTLVWVDTERLRWLDLADQEPACRLVVLNPDWLSKAIGFVIERDSADQVRTKGKVPVQPDDVPAGLVSKPQMNAIWSNPPQPKHTPPLVFPEGLFDFFRQLMRAFDIARPVRHGGKHDGEWYLVPSRLPTLAPAAWKEEIRRDGSPRVFWRAELRVNHDEPLNAWLGLAIFHRLMIVLHGDAQGRQDFARAAHWRRGFILAPAGTGQARIEYNGAHRKGSSRGVGFDIQVAAHQPRELWAVFSEALRHVIQDLERHYGYASIDVQRFVSCPADKCDRESHERFFMPEDTIRESAQSGSEDWRKETTVCNVGKCGRRIELGWLWDGRAVEDPGQQDRIEKKIDQLTESSEEMRREVGASRLEIEASTRQMAELRSELADIHHRLEAGALASEQALRRILEGQEELGRSLREALTRASEELRSRLRAYQTTLAGESDELPRLYTLRPLGRWTLPHFGRKKWRLRLHCEKTAHPARLFSNDGQGEFIIPETQQFLRTVGPYVKRVSTLLAALGPVTALISGTDTMVAVTPAIVYGLVEWARAYQTPIRRLSAMIEEESAAGVDGMVDTGQRPVIAEKRGLLWLHNYLRADPKRLNRLGLLAKRDPQGRTWWVLPEVDP
ncbi:MAG: hypothetical protein H7A47_18170, partial [Verrucomicrobiales bacterium]|nr:hypothetical protein [Verrucomicrobiales bacterium]